ncbi:ABC transporter permease [Vibrio fluvialis]|uniref:ABC transporter permease n=1 Tax=Vibrio fluvialis TaxID=676 RepID=UPI0006E35440|nr:ABC transporter permease [Vibrio fluvialis]KQH88783.1 ABC transporter permease [Vibrio fluvialis]MBY8113344.1 ABC transporter permease [Vibrio fluvialis]MBY8296489.1 ABC transporter permease [Vibrio fluvialis]MBY8313323.1 ABC transporter permease [Vibrio fluvialis]MCE7642504.1 ABC transporter permease [Vibrio fluvialis]
MTLIKLSIEFSRRELLTKYKGSILGALWLVASPIMLLLLYSAVFQYVFKARWDIDGQDFNFTLALFCGLAPYFFLTEMIGKSPDLVKNNSNLIKKVVFDRLSVPLSSAFSALFVLFVNLTLVFLFKIYDTHSFKLVWLTVYLYLIPLFFMGFTIATVFSSIGAYIKDLSSLANFINPVLMFVSPVFFDVNKISPVFSGVIGYNPLTPVIVNIRKIVLESYFSFSGFAVITVCSVIAAIAGVLIYRALEEDFADLA